jgi:hypothetical protein
MSCHELNYEFWYPDSVHPLDLDWDSEYKLDDMSGVLDKLHTVDDHIPDHLVATTLFGRLGYLKNEYRRHLLARKFAMKGLPASCVHSDCFLQFDERIKEIQDAIQELEWDILSSDEAFDYYSVASVKISPEGCDKPPESKSWKLPARVHRKDKKRRAKGADKKRRSILRDALADCA